MRIKRCYRCGKIIEDMCECYECVANYFNGVKVFFDLCEDCYTDFMGEFMIMESEDKE